MAADLHPEWISCLPSSWSYGVTRDGRVFFINEEAKSTTWLHPVSGEAVITGHRKTLDLPTGWEEGFSFEGARCFINHNERKVTCKHPVSGCPSQDNCIFVVNEQSAPKAPANEKERPLSTMSSEASNYTGSSDYATHQSSPAARPSRSSKKIHNFGKRSNSIRRNPNALVVKSNWLYKQDSTGMKLWKKRWFVLSDMCLYYYRDEKEEGILGSILLPSFRISMLSVDDHINRKYAFKATHPNMRTYYFCTDAAKDMESWMKVMTDAALVHSEPIRSRSLKVEQCGPQDVSNHVTQNHRPVLTRPEIQNNERNRTEVDSEHHTVAAITTVTAVTAEEEENRKQRDAERYGFQKEGAERDRPLTKINSIKLEPDQASAVPADITPDGPYRAPQLNGAGDQSPGEMMTNPQPHRTPSIQGSMTPTTPQYPHGEPEPRTLTRTNSMQQLEQWVRTQRVRNQDDDTHRWVWMCEGGGMSPEDYREHAYMCSPEDVDIDAKLSRLCEQDKVVRIREDKLQQLHREKHTLETALLSASQEIEMSADNPAAVHSVIQQRDVLQSGLLSTCRELSRVNTELERSWREYEKLEGDVSLAKNNLLEQLEVLGSPQTEPPSHQHVHIQKELWRIQDVMEALNKNKAQRHTDTQGYYGSTPISNKHKSEGPDYRLYKSEPELTTVAEVDETNGEDRSEQSDRDQANTKGMSYPVGIVPPRTKSPNMPNSSSITSYVTLRRGGRPDPRMERPHSAVEQLSGGAVEKDSGRSRMSVEEQLERIRRHQQGALREKKKGLHILAGSSCNSPQDYTTHSHSTTSTPSRSPSFTKENPFRSMQQNRRQRGEGMSSDILELEASLREQEVVREQETPAEEIARLKEATHTDHYNMDRELSVPEKVLIPERYVESDPEEALSPVQEADKQKKVDRIKALIAKNSMQNVLSPPGPEKEAEEEATAQDQEKMINISYELAAEASKRSKLVAVRSLSSSSPPPEPQPSSSPPPNTQPPPQLTDGSHFICV
ncbi:pleckstrin homology domain-containing family A member 5-like [Salvelinus namaycush]|uniref:Pleckstrin homology domain-containing family A member 5-like n=1 Tax=Salvelinus namaycush TaxID=8040 RepID=A0A8U1FAL2_SALNM|nr:pleckstrin homology domain-containing family A member 5-like [Salvelinus namaycush]